MGQFPGYARAYIAIVRTDGGVNVMEYMTRTRLDPLVDFAGWKPVESWFEREVKPEYVEAEIAELVKDHGPKHIAVSWRVMSETETAAYLNADRTFRSAWNADLSVDMDKAREIHKNNLRGARAPVMAALDVDYMRALEAGDEAKKAEIVAQKQALRDVTAKPEIATAKTPEELKAITL